MISHERFWILIQFLSYKYTLSAFYTLQSSGGYKDKKPSSLPLRDAPFSREACKHAKGVIKIQRGNACNKEQYMALDIHPTNVSYYYKMSNPSSRTARMQ